MRVILVLWLAATASAQTIGQITALRLINSISDNAIVNLVNGTVIALDTLIPRMTLPSFNIHVTVSGTDVASVRVGHNGTANVRTMNGPTYSFCGTTNSGRDFYKCHLLTLGTHTVTATPYTRHNAGGQRGTPVSVTFTLVDSLPPTRAPVRPPTRAPVRPPTPAPVRPLTRAPIPAPTVAPVRLSTLLPLPVPIVAPTTPAPSAPAPASPALSMVWLDACYVRNLQTKVETLVTRTATTYALSSSQGYSMRCTVHTATATDIDFLKFRYNNIEHDEFGEPRWLDGDSNAGDYVVPVPYLDSCGTKTIVVEGHSWSTLRFTQTYTLTATCAASPTKSPQALPTPVVPTLPRCGFPGLIGTWQSRPSHFPVAEAQGAMMGTDMVIVGGFLAGYDNVTTQTRSFDTTNPSAVWVRQDDYPFAQGVTHGAFVVVGTKFYMCGGYAGGGIGMHTDVCMVYDHSKPKGVGQQWSLFTPLPGGGRAGGGMVYDRTLNALIFSAGATRPIPQKRTALDHADTWLYSLSNSSAGWVTKAPMPFFANHMSSVTAMDATGKERHYFSGGQKGEDEHDGNQAEHFEYDAVNDQWFARKFMTIPRSHAASSTRAISCGLLMVAGCTNGGLKLSDISYYDISTDTWTKIGDLSNAINTPVCDISNNVLYCDTGWDSGRFSKKITIGY